MSHAVVAMIGEHNICLPTAGLIASTFMFAVSQSRTMSSLGRTVSILSLSAVLIVIVQCLVALRNTSDRPMANLEAETSYSLLHKMAAFGSIGFAVGSQKLFLNIRHEMTNRKKAHQSLAISLTLFGTFYVIVIMVSGSNPPDFLFDAIPAGLGRRIAGFLLWAHVVVSYAINSQAICSSVDRLVAHRVFQGIEAKTRWIILTFTFACASFTVANVIPFFSDLVSLIGAVTSVPLTLTLPVILWRKYLNEPVWAFSWQSKYSFALLVFSCIFAVGATTGSLYSIQKHWLASKDAPTCS